MADPTLIYSEFRQTGVLDMLSNKSMGIAGVAMLGTVAFLGTNAANAIDLSAAGTDDTGALVFAKETLTTKIKGTEDANKGMDYYRLADVNGNHNVVFESGIVSVSGETTILEITLEGLVFDGDLQATASPWTRRTGGARGETSATFSTTTVLDEGDPITVIAKFAISAAGAGSIVAKLTNRDLAEIVGAAKASKTYELRNAISLEAGLDEDVTPATPIAVVAEDFRSFKDTTPNAAAAATVQIASVGSLKIAIKAALLDAADGNESEVADIYDGTTSMITAKGDFSFASAASWQSTGTPCASISAAESLLQMDDDDNVMDELKAVPVADISTGMDGVAGVATAANSANLCIQVRAVDDEDAVEIPEVVEPYTVTTTYEVGTTVDAAFKPMGGTSDLGGIGRDGTTVRIPYLTTNDRYHQRIVILNRGGIADYRMSFMDEEGKMATAGMDAVGMLAAKKTTVLSLRDDEVVMIEGGTRTSGTLVVEAQPGNISVATVLHNVSTGNTDTVVLKD
jgi:hypothetical protein